MHYYKRNLGDYAKKAGRLSMLQHGAYTLLIDACYDREQFPTLEEAIDWTWASSAAEIEAVEFVLSKFFTLVDGTYVQARIKEEIDAYHETSVINKRIAADREAKRKEALTSRARSVDEAPPNQEPVTNNQEPVTNNQKPTEGEAPRKRSAPPPKPMAKVDDLIEAGFSPESAAEFIAHKAGMKAPLTERAWRDHLAESQKAGWTPLQAAEKVMAKTWKGFEAKYVAKEAPPTRATPISFADHDEARRRRRWEETTGRKWPTDNQTPDTFDMDEPPMRIEA